MEQHYGMFGEEAEHAESETGSDGHAQVNKHNQWGEKKRMSRRSSKKKCARTRMHMYSTRTYDDNT